jgi:DNA-binding NtrC family response regulator
MNILIVDDEELLLTLLEDFIIDIDSGINVFTSSNSENAISIVNESAIDFIICDYNMPKVNGLEILKLLNHNDNLSPFFCLMSGEIPNEIFNIKYQTKIRILRKPFNFDELKEMIREILKVI